jgi:predicted AlkP superfamily pyrophosphatase or phosphodiesterase
MKLADTDQKVIDVSVEKLSQGNPDFLFVGLNGTDSAGHDFGFRATIPEYVSAIKQVDGWIGDLTAAVKAREQYANEDWLVLVSTDHGGGAKQAKKHAEGQQADEEGGFVNSTIFIYASRDGQPAQQLEGLRQVDVAPTVLHHLGISIPEHYEGIALQQILTNNQMD